MMREIIFPYFIISPPPWLLAVGERKGRFMLFLEVVNCSSLSGLDHDQ